VYARKSAYQLIAFPITDIWLLTLQIYLLHPVLVSSLLSGGNQVICGCPCLNNLLITDNLIIYDKNNHPVITKQNLLAKNAAGTDTIVFPAAQIYHIQVQITGLLKPGQTPDFTRNGVATGYVVVPEFPAAP